MKSSKLTPQQVQILRDWGRNLRTMFNGAMPYHVGSSLTSDQWRDVDIRIILDDKTHRRLAKTVDIGRLNLTLTVWGERATGLPIDCQVQSMTEANDDPFNEGQRNPLAMRWSPDAD